MLTFLIERKMHQKMLIFLIERKMHQKMLLHKKASKLYFPETGS
jgi:hypothetical protein